MSSTATITSSPIYVETGLRKTHPAVMEDQLPPLVPPSWSLKEIRDQIPPHLFERSTAKALGYALRDLVLATILFVLALKIDWLCDHPMLQPHLVAITSTVLRTACWITYWWFQGLVFTGIWVIGHECGHGAFSPNPVVCNIIGFTLHSLLWTPYFSWKFGHHRHHSNHASMEKDEVYVPRTRQDLGIPSGAKEIDWDEYFGDTPIYTLYTLVRQQLLAFEAYLLWNVSGQKHYPKWTNHFDPKSIIFDPSQRGAVIASNVGLLVAGTLLAYGCARFGFARVAAFYGVPWVLVTHWFVMITYLHHTDPALPHYRGRAWSFQGGAAATVDRDFLGWQGRFFLHDVAHYHVVHHFFPRMPWYNGEAATAYLARAMGPYYRRSSKPCFRALWDNYNFCQFVDDEGDMVFYRDRRGKTMIDYRRIQTGGIEKRDISS
ncbi:linoleoyl phosphatidylcholine delta-12 acetylenase [Trametes versicolor FP-101664 SS1]|uniref:linoleoyl phosphatidylcholine delta-12 acetylenase n=1 Tax=Trametes versicolor (strain FP-101664) TaxID=717944 RepID=UPI0004621276|nr:linoleoyl phosphatidylcholine delta-12 acetylenase [Trametes versicolor FP-101664 SS1]EIW53389.1 linoleoyl phosphatidylcholine delta-12 acetylenase [Trametes versicolor FP-101664 SS1]